MSEDWLFDVPPGEDDAEARDEVRMLLQDHLPTVTVEERVSMFSRTFDPTTPDVPDDLLPPADLPDVDDPDPFDWPVEVDIDAGHDVDLGGFW